MFDGMVHHRPHTAHVSGSVRNVAPVKHSQDSTRRLYRMFYSFTAAMEFVQLALSCSKFNIVSQDVVCVRTNERGNQLPMICICRVFIELLLRGKLRVETL